jgi:hypothetical protein
MATFGGRGKRPGGRPAGAQNEIFIKGALKKDETRAKYWILDENPPFIEDANGNEIPGWFNFEQHYDPSVKRSWPCAMEEGEPHCVGCEFPIEDPTDENDRGLNIRKTGSQYIIPVIDEQGYVSLIQLGWGLWQDFCTKFREYGTLTDAWYVVTKSKAGGKTMITCTRTNDTDKPEVKIAVPDEGYISQSLGKRYLEAMERYGYDPDDDGEGPDPEPQGGDEAQADPAAAAQAAEDADSGWDRALVAKDAGVGELKDWLDNVPEKWGGPIEYPKGKVGRPILVGLVEKAQADLPPF